MMRRLWTDEEDRLLAQELTDAQVAVRLGRTENSVACRRSYLRGKHNNPGTTEASLKPVKDSRKRYGQRNFGPVELDPPIRIERDRLLEALQSGKR